MQRPRGRAHRHGERPPAGGTHQRPRPGDGGPDRRDREAGRPATPRSSNWAASPGSPSAGTAPGLSLTGNELSPNDEQVGISRSHQVLEMMRARTLDEMVAMALRPDRASSYNNVLTSADGGVANVEGSATDAEVTGLDDCRTPRPYEPLRVRSHAAVRRRPRLREALGGAVRTCPDPARRTAARIDHRDHPAHRCLSDHEGAPDSICRHPEPGDGEGSKTVFWCIADVTDGRITFGRGNPCDSMAQDYAFSPYAA